MRIQRKIPNSNGVAAGQTATWDLPIGARYHALQLEYSGTTFDLSHMTELRVIANGEVLHRYSGAQRDKMNVFDGRAAAAGILTIPFDRFALYQQKGEEATAIQTGSAGKDGVAITSFKLEMDIAATAVAPSVKVTATQSDNDPKIPGPGLVLRVMPYVRVLGSGQAEVSDFPKGTEGPKFTFVNRVFFVSAQATALKVERDNRTIFERTKALNDRVQLDGVRAPQAGYFVFDPTEEGYDYEPVAMVAPDGKAYQDFRYTLTLTAGETVTALVEYLGTLRG